MDMIYSKNPLNLPQWPLLLSAVCCDFINPNHQLPAVYLCFPADIVVPLATKSLMLEFCLTHPDSTRMLFPGGNTITIQSTSASHGIRDKAEEIK